MWKASMGKGRWKKDDGGMREAGVGKRRREKDEEWRGMCGEIRAEEKAVEGRAFVLGASTDDDFVCCSRA